MNKKLNAFFVFLMLMVSMNTISAEKFTRKDVVEGSLSPKGISNGTPMKGDDYAQLSSDRKKIMCYSFLDEKKNDVLMDVDVVSKQTEEKIDKISGFKFSPDKSKILVWTDRQDIYRRSYMARYFVYDIDSKSFVSLTKRKDVQTPVFSNNSKLIAFMCDGNIFLVDMVNGTETQVTTDGKRGTILNGTPDWVYEEEFSTNCSLVFTNDDRFVVWIRYDESDVKEYSLQLVKASNPVREEYAVYPGSYSYKYPKAGEDNSKITLMCYDIESNKSYPLNVPMDEDGYMPRIFASNVDHEIIAVTMNRHQNLMRMYRVNTQKEHPKADMIIEEKDDKYIDEIVVSNLILTKKNILIQSDRTGYNHLYIYDYDGNVVRTVGEGNDIITNIYDYDESIGTVYLQMVGNDPTKRIVVASDPNGSRVLSEKEGWNTIRMMSADKQLMIEGWSDKDNPTVYTLRNTVSGEAIRTIEDNETLKDKYAKYNLCSGEFFSFSTTKGDSLYGIMFKPSSFQKDKKYPAIIYQYGGPGNQQVLDNWNEGYAYERYLAQEGYIVVVVDGRGTGGRGADFQKCTYLRLGEKESEDMVETAIYLASLPNVRKESIGIWGWSYGGFNTLMSMSEGRDVFACGVAVAPPTNWRYYDTVYTERYMRTPKENKTGYDEVSPMGRVKKLHGKLLICHGIADDNVHIQNTYEYADALVQADKDFRMVMYPNRNHGIRGGNCRNHLYRQITDFFNENLHPNE